MFQHQTQAPEEALANTSHGPTRVWGLGRVLAGSFPKHRMCLRYVRTCDITGPETHGLGIAPNPSKQTQVVLQRTQLE